MDVTERKVSWGFVIMGIVVALVAGFVVTIVSTMAGMAIYDEVHSKALGVLVAVALPTALIVIVYLLNRRGAPDFARGLLIGGCVVLLWASTCGYNMVGARIGG
jgi:hypothetical protein